MSGSVKQGIELIVKLKNVRAHDREGYEKHSYFTPNHLTLTADSKSGSVIELIRASWCYSITTMQVRPSTWSDTPARFNVHHNGKQASDIYTCKKVDNFYVKLGCHSRSVSYFVNVFHSTYAAKNVTACAYLHTGLLQPPVLLCTRS